MTKANELLNEALIELRSYMFQSYSTSRAPSSLLRIQELLLDAKDELDCARVLDTAEYIENTLTKMNQVNSL